MDCKKKYRGKLIGQKKLFKMSNLDIQILLQELPQILTNLMIWTEIPAEIPLVFLFV